MVYLYKEFVCRESALREMNFRRHTRLSMKWLLRVLVSIAFNSGFGLRATARLSAQASVLAHDLQPALHLAQANLCQLACILARLQHVLQGLHGHALAVWKLQPIQHMFQRIQAIRDAFGYSLQLAFLFCAARDRSDGVAVFFDCADQLVASCLCL